MSSTGMDPALPLPELSLTDVLPTGRVMVEASAGTGKTYALSALVVRAIAEGAVTTPQLLVVTFTRAAAAELRDRIRAALMEAEAVLDGAPVPARSAWMSALLSDDPDIHGERAWAVRRAVASFDEATITTIHGFCQQALRQLGMRSGTRLGAELGDGLDRLIDEVCRDLLISKLWMNPAALSAPSKSELAPAVFDRLVEVVKDVLANPSAIIEPKPGSVKSDKTELLQHVDTWFDVVNTAVDLVVQRRTARRELGYDDLVGGLHRAVVGDDEEPTEAAEPAEPAERSAAAKALDAQFNMVLVDESQDTDPVQWEIFESAFTGTLITVGDPKQAIYRFRGADLHAYLQAASRPSVTRFGLSTNYRSDAELVAATNALICGFDLGDERIVAHPVKSAHSGPGAIASIAPIEIRRLADSESMHTANGGMSAPLSYNAVLSDLVDQVVQMLTGTSIDTGDGSRPVAPGDFAVLVPGRRHAEDVVNALVRVGVPAVRARTGSVFATAAAAEIRLLLAALQRFTHAPTVRAAALGVFLRRSAAAIDPQGEKADEVLGELQRACALWADLLGRMPFLAWYDTVRAQSGLTAALLADTGGERLLTDLDHIAELLAAELGTSGNPASRVIQVLESAVAHADNADETGPQMRRIDTDAAAVQVLTVHGSKGLQFPIVLLPFSYEAPKSRGPSIYSTYVADDDPNRHTIRRKRIIDVMWGTTWHGHANHDKEKARTHRTQVELRGDSLRLLYVGLTRAEHRTVIWYAPLPGSRSTALSHVLFDRDPVTGAPLNTRPSLTFGTQGGPKPFMPGTVPDNDTAHQLLEALASYSGGVISHTTIAERTRPLVWTPAVASVHAPVLAIADPHGRDAHDRTWGRWSFTGLTRTVADAHAAPVSGGNDEGAPAPSAAEDASGGAISLPWLSVGGGRHFGVFVHEVMEHVDPTSPDLRAHVRPIVERQLLRTRVPAPAEILVEGIARAVETPLGPITGGRRLADIAVSDRLAEMRFDLPLLDTRTAVDASVIGSVLLDTLAADDVVRPYATDLASGRFSSRIAGFLQGSIDAVLRVGGPDGAPQFLVVDYKTNTLHEPGMADPIAAYHPDLLINAMVKHDYPLQAVLYSVGLHRFLRLRLAGYDPAVHLGGIAYLFMRGMVGSDTPMSGGRPYGVFSWVPPHEAVVELDRVFSRERAA